MGFEPFVDAPAPDEMIDDVSLGLGQQVARAGSPLSAGSAVADEQMVVEALRSVYDPEIPVNIYDLGLIYALVISDTGNVTVDMTLTAPSCPVAGELPGAVADTVAQVDGVGDVAVRLVWEPRWTPERMSEDARLAIGYM